MDAFLGREGNVSPWLDIHSGPGRGLSLRLRCSVKSWFQEGWPRSPEISRGPWLTLSQNHTTNSVPYLKVRDLSCNMADSWHRSGSHLTWKTPSIYKNLAMRLTTLHVLYWYKNCVVNFIARTLLDWKYLHMTSVSSSPASCVDRHASARINGRVHPGGLRMKRGLNQNLSGNEVYCTNL